jgi:hypothetical protein
MAQLGLFFLAFFLSFCFIRYERRLACLFHGSSRSCRSDPSLPLSFRRKFDCAGFSFGCFCTFVTCRVLVCNDHGSYYHSLSNHSFDPESDPTNSFLEQTTRLFWKRSMASAATSRRLLIHSFRCGTRTAGGTRLRGI